MLYVRQELRTMYKLDVFFFLYLVILTHMNPPATHTHPYSITPREINFEGTALKSHVYFLVKHYILKAQSYYIYYDIKKKILFCN